MKLNFLIQFYKCIKLKGVKSKKLPDDLFNLLKLITFNKFNSILEEEQEEKMNEDNLKRKRLEERNKDLTNKQKKLLKR